MDATEAQALLGVEEGATPEAIKAAYRRTAKEAHPDAASGTEAKWEALSEAYDLLLARAGNRQELVPLSVALDLARSQERGLAKRERNKQHAKRAEETLRSIVRSQTSRLDERKRKAWAVGVGAAGVAVVVTLLRAVALAGIGGDENAVLVFLISALSVAAGIAAGFGWILRLRAERLAHFVEDAATQLSDRGQYGLVLNEIEREGGYASPWSPEELEEAVGEWSLYIGDFDRRSMGMQALKIGAFDFTRLLISKGLESGMLEEMNSRTAECLTITYRPAQEEAAV